MTQAQLRQYILRWTERTTENDGFGDEIGVSFTERSVTIEAQTADEASDKWENEYANEGTNGLDSLHRIIEHPLLAGYIRVEIPNDDNYAVSIDGILREHATSVVYKRPDADEDDVADYIEQHSIPLFENDADALLAWAKEHTKWDDLVEGNWVKRFKMPPQKPVDKAEYWKTGQHIYLAKID